MASTVRSLYASPFEISFIQNHNPRCHLLFSPSRICCRISAIRVFGENNAMVALHHAFAGAFVILVSLFRLYLVWTLTILSSSSSACFCSRWFVKLLTFSFSLTLTFIVVNLCISEAPVAIVVGVLNGISCSPDRWGREYWPLHP